MFNLRAVRTAKPTLVALGTLVAVAAGAACSGSSPESATGGFDSLCEAFVEAAEINPTNPGPFIDPELLESPPDEIADLLESARAGDAPAGIEALEHIYDTCDGLADVEDGLDFEVLREAVAATE